MWNSLACQTTRWIINISFMNMIWIIIYLQTFSQSLIQYEVLVNTGSGGYLWQWQKPVKHILLIIHEENMHQFIILAVSYNTCLICTYMFIQLLLQGLWSNKKRFHLELLTSRVFLALQTLTDLNNWHFWPTVDVRGPPGRLIFLNNESRARSRPIFGFSNQATEFGGTPWNLNANFLHPFQSGSLKAECQIISTWSKKRIWHKMTLAFY